MFRLPSVSASEKANTKKDQASEKQAEVTIQSQAIEIEKVDATEALAAALPALEAARLALADLNKNDITEIRSFASPPSQVQYVCECVAIIKGLSEISWKSCKAMMSEGGFLRSLMEMNCEVITPKQIARCKKHLKEADTSYDSMRSVSRAGFGLLKFVNAVLNFCEVYKDVKPKKDKVESLERELATQVAMLEKLNREIKEMEAILADLNEKYLVAMKEKEVLTAALNQAEARLVSRSISVLLLFHFPPLVEELIFCYNRYFQFCLQNAANRLLTGLSSEKERWLIDLSNYRKDLTKIVGTSLLAAAFLAYCGPFTSEYREKMIYGNWLKDIREREIPISEPFAMDGALTNEVEIAMYVIRVKNCDDRMIEFITE